jgi:hypothetical protein
MATNWQASNASSEAWRRAVEAAGCFGFGAGVLGGGLWVLSDVGSAWGMPLIDYHRLLWLFLG